MKINLNLKVREDVVGGPLAPIQSSSDYFPELTITQKKGDEEFDLGKLSKDGEMTVRYKMTRTSENTKTGVCTYTFEVREIVSASGSKNKSPAKNYGEDAGAALDRLAKEKADENSDEGEY